MLRWDVVWSSLRVLNDSTITGFHLVNGWAKERYLYFAARYSRPFDDYGIMKDGKPVRYDGYRFRSRSRPPARACSSSRTMKPGRNEVIQVKAASRRSARPTP